MKKIIYANKFPKEFDFFESYVKDVISRFCDNLELTCVIRIKFVKTLLKNEYVELAKVDSLSTNKHILYLSYDLLYSIGSDTGNLFCMTILHELVHINDYIRMVNTGLFKIDIRSKEQTEIDDFDVVRAFTFFTEFNAYYETLKFAKYNKFKFEDITFSGLVSLYRKIIDADEEYETIGFKSDLDVINYMEMTEKFVHFCARFMAAVHAGYSEIPYDKIKANNDYDKVLSIIKEIGKVFEAIYKSPYGPDAYNNLLKLGDHLGVEIYKKLFKIDYIRTGYFIDCVYLTYFKRCLFNSSYKDNN